jgi:hypothetical protein
MMGAGAVAGAMAMSSMLGGVVVSTEEIEATRELVTNTGPLQMMFGAIPVLLAVPSAIAFKLWKNKEDSEKQLEKEEDLKARALETQKKKADREAREAAAAEAAAAGEDSDDSYFSKMFSKKAPDSFIPPVVGKLNGGGGGAAAAAEDQQNGVEGKEEK